MSLNELRKRIDALDRRLVPLLNERTAVARAIGEVKHRAGAPAYVPAREREVYRRVQRLNEGPLAAAGLHAIYREIMSAALAGERHARVVCRGPAGGLAALAAKSRFGASVKYRYRPTAMAVAADVAEGRGACGVVWREELAQVFLVPPEKAPAVRIGAEIVLSPVEGRAPAQYFAVLCPRGDAPDLGEKTTLRLGACRRQGGMLATLAKALGSVPVLRFERAAAGDAALVELSGDARGAELAPALKRLSRSFAEVTVLGSYIAALENDGASRGDRE